MLNKWEKWVEEGGKTTLKIKIGQLKKSVLYRKWLIIKIINRKQLM